MNAGKETILILSPGFAESEGDTSCLPAQQSLIRCCNHLFPDINIIILSFQYPYTKQSYQWYGNTVIPFNGRNRGKLFRLLTWVRVWYTLKRLHKEQQVLGLLSFWLGECALVGHYFSKRNKLLHYTWLLGQDARKGNPYAKRIPLQANSLIAISDFIADHFFENYLVRPSYMIPNAIDPLLYENVEIKKDIDIIGVGSLIPLKRYAVFIDVIKEIYPDLPGLKVMICGKGPEYEKLLKQIKVYGLENTIELAGEKKHADVLKLMQRSRVMLHTSSYEGFSGACLEALYARANVVSFINPVNGWIKQWHTVKNKNEMIKKTRALLTSPNLDHHAVLAFPMERTARLMMQLFTG